MSVPPTVIVSRNALTIRECPPELADALSYVQTRTAFENSGMRTMTGKVAYAEYDSHTRLCRTYPNALHLVADAAKKMGIDLSIRDQRLLPGLDLRQIAAEELGTFAYQALKTVAQANSSGLVIGLRGAEKTAVLCGLASMAPPYYKVLVTTEDRAAALQIHQSLTERFGGEKIGLHAGTVSEKGRIIVTHLDALQDFVQGENAHCGYGLRDFDVWICDDAHRLPAPGRIPFLNQFRTVYCWGLSATLLRADNSHQLNAVIFGPVLFREAGGDCQISSGNESVSTAVKATVFPLTTDRLVPETFPIHKKVRLAYLTNPKLTDLLRGIDSHLPDKARVMIVVDSWRLGIILKRWMPGYSFARSGDPHEILQRISRGEMTRVIDLERSEEDVPELDYLIDCCTRSAPSVLWQRSLARGGKSSCYVMLLCLTSEELFGHGINRLQSMAELGWDVSYMFPREVVDHLPFVQAPLLPELGLFLEE